MEGRKLKMQTKLFYRWIRYQLLFRPLAFLPAIIAYRIARFIGYVDSRINSTAAKAYFDGLSKAQPHLSATQRGCFWQGHCEMMAREILDIFRLSKISSDNCQQIIDIQGLDVLQQARQGARGVILAMGHFGRPTMLSTGLGVNGHKIGMVTQIIDERNPNLNSVERGYLAFKMKQTVAASQGRWIMLGGSMRSLYDGLKSGEVIILLFDLYEGRQKNVEQTAFLGGQLTLPRGIERVAKKTGAKIIYGVARDAGRRVEVELRGLPEEPHEALLAAVKELEKDVSKTPWQWWQWGMIDHIWDHSAPS